MPRDRYPARRRDYDDEDDYDDRPRRRRPVKGSAGWVVPVVVGVVLVVFVGLAGGYFLLARELSKPKPPPPVVVAPTVTPAAPVRDTTRVLLRLSNLKKGFAAGGANALQVDYVVEEADELAGATLYLVARFKSGTADMRFTPERKGSGTVNFHRVGAFGGFAGETQVWVERESGGARERVSNIATAY